MVTDEERREVAQKLRERTNRPLEAGVKRMLSETAYCGMEIER